MKRHIASSFALLLIFFCLAGCVSPNLFEFTPQPSYAYEAEYRDAWQYAQLDERLKTAYANVYEAVEEMGDADTELKIHLSKPLYSKSEATALYNAFTRDNPQFFYIGNTYRCEGVTVGDATRYDTFYLGLTMNTEQRVIAKQKLSEAVQTLTADLPSGTEIDVEIVLHDRLVEQCTYLEAAATTNDGASLYPTAFTAYGALVQGQAVCEGYARGLQLLLSEVGIHGTVVTGTDANGESHMWNMVELQGRTYHADATWNDSNDRLRHAYLNLSDEEILKTHRFDKENPALPVCDSTAAGYYRYTGRYIDDEDPNVIAAVIAQDIKRGKEAVDLQFSIDTYEKAKTCFSQFSGIADRVNTYGITMWKYRYIADDDRQTISIYKID